MSTCPDCEAPQPEGAAFCAACGASLTPFVRTRLERQVADALDAELARREVAAVADAQDAPRKARIGELRERMALQRREVDVAPSTLSAVIVSLLRAREARYNCGIMIISTLIFAFALADAITLNLTATVAAAGIADLLGFVLLAWIRLQVARGAQRIIREELVVAERELRGLEADAARAQATVAFK